MRLILSPDPFVRPSMSVITRWLKTLHRGLLLVNRGYRREPVASPREVTQPNFKAGDRTGIMNLFSPLVYAPVQNTIERSGDDDERALATGLMPGVVITGADHRSKKRPSRRSAAGLRREFFSGATECYHQQSPIDLLPSPVRPPRPRAARRGEDTYPTALQGVGGNGRTSWPRHVEKVGRKCLELDKSIGAGDRDGDWEYTGGRYVRTPRAVQQPKYPLRSSFSQHRRPFGSGVAATTGLSGGGAAAVGGVVSGGVTRYIPQAVRRFPFPFKRRSSTQEAKRSNRPQFGLTDGRRNSSVEAQPAWEREKTHCAKQKVDAGGYIPMNSPICVRDKSGRHHGLVQASPTGNAARRPPIGAVRRASADHTIRTFGGNPRRPSNKETMAGGISFHSPHCEKRQVALPNMRRKGRNYHAARAPATSIWPMTTPTLPRVAPSPIRAAERGRQSMAYNVPAAEASYVYPSGGFPDLTVPALSVAREREEAPFPQPPGPQGWNAQGAFGWRGADKSRSNTVIAPQRLERADWTVVRAEVGTKAAINGPLVSGVVNVEYFDGNGVVGVPQAVYSDERSAGHCPVQSLHAGRWCGVHVGAC